MFLLGVLISGGYGLNTVELFLHPEDVARTGITPCLVPALGNVYWRHTMNNLTVCGGLDHLNNAFGVCATLDVEAGGWPITHTLGYLRCRHLSWDQDDGFYLIGGDNGGINWIDTVENVWPDGTGLWNGTVTEEPYTYQVK